LDKLVKEKPEEQVEEMAVGSVTAGVYLDYFRSGDSILGIVFLIFGFVLTQVLLSISEIWLSMW
jgi:hypothetical protein